MKIRDKLEMCRPGTLTPSIIKEPPVTMESSHPKASATLDSFDKIYPLLVSVLSKPLRAILPQIIHIVHASLISRKRPWLHLEKYIIINISMKFKFLSIGGNTVMWNIWSTHVYVGACARTISVPLYNILPMALHFCFKCHLTPFSNVKPTQFVCLL